MKRWAFLIASVFGAACLAQIVATAIPTVEVSIEPPGTPYTIPECQPASGVTIKVQKMSDTIVELIASGLIPGETPYVYYNTPVGNIVGTGGAYSGYTANDNGEFYFELENLEPPPGQASVTWDIRLMHERGVECTTITLP